MFTRADGTLAEERRFEPFGAPLEAARPGVSSTIVDFTVEPTNDLNKETDPATGFSYHGARWLDPRIARWTEPDPPTKAPDAKFMRQPWELNPYQYVDQNPITFWDPDGRSPLCFDRLAPSRSEAASTSKPTTVSAATSTTAPARSSVPKVEAPARSAEAWHPPMAAPEPTPAAAPSAPTAPSPVEQERVENAAAMSRWAESNYCDAHHDPTEVTFSVLGLLVGGMGGAAMKAAHVAHGVAHAVEIGVEGAIDIAGNVLSTECELPEGNELHIAPSQTPEMCTHDPTTAGPPASFGSGGAPSDAAE
jgi:RHS repeat-associated protein